MFVQTVLVADENANSYVLSGLQEFTQYDVKVAAYNKVGHSPYSPVTSDTTRESGRQPHKALTVLYRNKHLAIVMFVTL